MKIYYFFEKFKQINTAFKYEGKGRVINIDINN